MEQSPSDPTTSSPAKPSHKKWPVLTSAFLVAAIVVGGTGFGVYIWQRNEANKKEQALLNEINTLKNTSSQEDAQATGASISYTSKVGGLTLTLPSQYVVIVNVDGNKGGAPGSTLRIGNVISPGIISDNVYEWVEIEIGHLSATLDQEAKIVSDQLSENGFENIETVDSIFKGIPAKLLTADGLGYDAKRRIYIVKSGEFIYQFTSKTGDSSKDDEMLKAVLEGSSIEEKTLD